MKKYSTQLAVYLLTIFMMCTTAVAVDVEFYSLNSTHSDSSKIKMTEDLFYTQLLSLPEYRVVDKRPSSYSGNTDNPNQDTMIFHGELQEQDNTWICTLTLEQPHLNKKSQVTSNYDSYFKILSDAKSSISQLFANISSSSTSVASSKTAPQGSAGVPTFDSLSGTWSGESSINKIVLLRGGRGFVIFNNGASMNINVEIQGSTIVCTQSGKPNASFFPELPREVALVAAMDAQPITWTMTLSNNSTLTGTKQSLQAIMVAGSAVGAEMGTSQVTWTRQ
ncbi:MAG: hypothetical protein U0I22_07620 [Treponema sp.]|nr:hypothetical protein [Treponema sp.]